jgi:ABC-type transporter Mla maintaining outer membrane lipid asymmetry ATPase subunit MlaF
MSNRKFLFLYEGRAIFFGPHKDTEKSNEPIIHEFLELDELKLEA